MSDPVRMADSNAWTPSGIDPFAESVQAILASGRGIVAVLPIVEHALDTAALLQRLTRAERERASRFRFDKDRRLYIAAHGLFTLLVEAALGPRGEAWRLTASINGSKPKLETGNAAPLFANLSHTRGMAAVGVSRRAEIGIDVETVRPMRDLTALAAFAMTPRERVAIAAAPTPAPVFCRLWTRKEAVLKAHGIGLGAPLAEIDVLDRNTIHAPGLPPAPRTLIDLDVGSEVKGSVCVLEQDSDVIVVPFRPGGAAPA